MGAENRVVVPIDSYLESKQYESNTDREKRYGMIFSYFDSIRQQPPDSRKQEIYRVFSKVIHQSRGRSLLYWVLSRNLDLVEDTKALFFEGTSGDPELMDQMHRKIASLEELGRVADLQREQLSNGANSENTFAVSPDTTRRIFNALKYNDQGVDLVLLDEVVLPGIPGRMTLAIHQNGGSWGMKWVLKSAPINVTQDVEWDKDFEGTFGSLWGEESRLPGLVRYKKEVESQAVLDHAIGNVRFCEYPGHKPKEYASIAAFSSSLLNQGDKFFSGSLEVTRVSSEVSERDMRLLITDGRRKKEYVFSPVICESSRKGGAECSIDGLLLEQSVDQHQLGSYEDFAMELGAELEVFSRVLDYVYARSAVKLEDSFILQPPGMELIEGLGGAKVLERVYRSSNSFSDLGGQRELKRQLERDAQNFIKSYRGEAGLKPQNTILYGETGIGKTALTNGVVNELLKGDIPVFVLKGDLFAKTLEKNPQQAVAELKNVFYYLLIYGGAIVIRDMDALLGAREQPGERNLVQAVLLSELQRIKEEPSTWLIADSQFLGRIAEIGDGALLNAHRIGKHLEVKIETELEPVQQLVLAVLRRVDAESTGNQLSLADIQSKYPVNIQHVAQSIISHGGIIPAQVERAVREIFSDEQNLTTETFVQKINDIVVERKRLLQLREEQRLDELNSRTTEALVTARDAITRLEIQAVQLQDLLRLVTRLDSENGKLRAEMAELQRERALLLRRIGEIEERDNSSNA